MCTLHKFQMPIGLKKNIQSQNYMSYSHTFILCPFTVWSDLAIHTTNLTPSQRSCDPIQTHRSYGLQFGNGVLCLRQLGLQAPNHGSQDVLELSDKNCSNWFSQQMLYHIIHWTKAQVHRLLNSMYTSYLVAPLHFSHPKVEAMDSAPQNAWSVSLQRTADQLGWALSNSAR